jgi:hypothetical protein
MSEAVGGAAGAGGSASTSTAAAGSSGTGAAASNSTQTASSNGSQGGNFQPANANPGAPGGNPGETAAETQARILAEQDLDAFVEQTVNGQKERVKVRDLLKSHGLDKAANEKLRQAAEMRKQLQAEIQKIQSMSLEDFARARKIDLDKQAEELLAQKYELANMSPEQREAYENKQKLEQYQKLEISSKRQLADQIKDLTGEALTDDQLRQVPRERLINYIQAKTAEHTQAKGALEQEFVAAWKESGLPAHARWGRLIAQALYQDGLQRKIAMKNGQEVNSAPLQAKEAAAKVKAQWLSESREILGQMDATAILSWLGNEIWQKLRDHDVKRVTEQSAPFGGRQSPGHQPASEQTPKKYVNQHEWRKLMGID